MITARVDVGRYLQKLRHLPREADRVMREAVEVDARGFIKDIVAVTPPSMGKANKTAQTRGEAAVARDVRKVYATPSELYALLQDRATHLVAPFWAAVRRKDWPAANRILRSQGLPEMERAQIDGGSTGRAAEHARRSRQGRVRGTQPSAAVTEVKTRARYIKAMQRRVGLLASGFLAAAQRLGVKLPAWITRHGARAGAVRVKNGWGSFSIEIVNRARHGRGNDLPRRIEWVLRSDKRTKRLAAALKFRVRAVLHGSGARLRV